MVDKADTQVDLKFVVNNMVVDSNSVVEVFGALVDMAVGTVGSEILLYVELLKVAEMVDSERLLYVALLMRHFEATEDMFVKV